jgi:hypothetical protein
MSRYECPSVAVPIFAPKDGQMKILDVKNVDIKIKQQILILLKIAKLDAENMQKESNTNSATTTCGINTIDILKTEEPWI